MNRYENGAPAQKELEARSVNVGRSAHDFSFSHAGNTLLGIIAPVDVFDVVPNEDLDISISALLEFRNPAVRPIYNGFRVYFHTYYNRLSDLWEGAKNFIDNGRSGKINLTRPNLIYYVTHTETITGGTVSLNANSCTPLSLLNFMGLPVQALHADSDSKPLFSFTPAFEYVNQNDSKKSDYSKNSESPSYFPADVAFAYQKNWRDFYSSKNLLQNNKHWFPDNEDHFILSYSCENAVCIKYEDEDLDSDTEKIFLNITGSSTFLDDEGDDNVFNFTREPNNPTTSVPESWDSSEFFPNLSAIKFHQFRGDRFTTSSPFADLIRGDIPVLSLNKEDLIKVQGYALVDGKVSDTPSSNVPLYSDVDDRYNFGSFASDTNATLYDADTETSYFLKTKNPLSLVTMSDIYTLETLTAFKRKMGMTNGDYNETVKAQFGVSPHAHDRRATYIGGFYQDFALSTVIQQSESGSTPLGTKASNGVSAGSGRIGSFHVPDYGWISTYMFVLSDVYYTQGKPRMFSKKNSIDMYFPLFNNLPAQAIRNDELFISGSDSTDSTPFSYEPRYEEYKARNNRVSGFMGLSHSVASYDSARIMSRRFSTLPAFNSNFVTMIPENVDMEIFSVVDEPPFDFNVGVSVRRVFPGPYVAMEGSLSSPALA